MHHNKMEKSKQLITLVTTLLLPVDLVYRKAAPKRFQKVEILIRDLAYK